MLRLAVPQQLGARFPVRAVGRGLIVERHRSLILRDRRPSVSAGGQISRKDRPNQVHLQEVSIETYNATLAVKPEVRAQFLQNCFRWRRIVPPEQAYIRVI